MDARYQTYKMGNWVNLQDYMLSLESEPLYKKTRKNEQSLGRHLEMWQAGKLAKPERGTPRSYSHKSKNWERIVKREPKREVQGITPPPLDSTGCTLISELWFLLSSFPYWSTSHTIILENLKVSQDPLYCCISLLPHTSMNFSNTSNWCELKSYEIAIIEPKGIKSFHQI